MPSASRVTTLAIAAALACLIAASASAQESDDPIAYTGHGSYSTRPATKSPQR